MNIIHKLCLAAIGVLIIAAAVIPTSALAGTSDNPEITDVAGDSTSGIKSRDLTEAWFHDEANDSFMINMTLSALESYTTKQEITNVPTTEYEVYFSLGDSNFAAACKVPVHGPLGVTIQFDIRKVTYSNNTNTTVESSISALSNCKYDVTNHNILWKVMKISLSNVTAGQHLTKTWAAVYNKNIGESQRKMEDRGPNSGYGRDFIITGVAGGAVIDVQLSAESTSQSCKPGTPATFTLYVINNGTSQISVELFNTTVSQKGWTVDFSLNNLTIPINITRKVTIQIFCPRDAANKTAITIGVYGKLVVPTTNQTGTTNMTYLTATVNYIPPKPIEDTLLVKVGKFFTQPTLVTYILYVLIVLAVVVGSVGAAMRSRSRRKREELAAVPFAPLPVK